MNIRELDEESRRTGVWPPRRIILRVEREGDDAEASPDGRSAPVKVGEVDLTASPAPAAAAPAPAPASPAPSPSPSASPIRRPTSARAVAPAAAPTTADEDAEFDKWLAEPLAISESDPEYQPRPDWLPEYRRVHAERRHRRITRKARAQLFGASAATTLAVGGCAAAIALVGLSQTETVGGSLGVPSIGLFGAPAEPPSRNETADRATPKPAVKKAERKPARRERGAPAAEPRSERADRPRRRARGARRDATPAPAARRPASARRSTPSATRRPARAVNPPPPPPRAVNPPPPPPRAVSPPPPPPAASSPATRAPVAPSRPAGVAPSRPAPTPPPTSSSPALDSDPGLG